MVYFKTKPFFFFSSAILLICCPLYNILISDTNYEQVCALCNFLYHLKDKKKDIFWQIRFEWFAKFRNYEVLISSSNNTNI